MRKNWPVKWQLLETKARFINQVMNGSVTVRQAEDLEGGALTYAEIKAIASGNPAVMEKVKVDTEIRKLDQLRSSHINQQHNIRWQVKSLPSEIERARKYFAAVSGDILARDARADEDFTMRVGNRVYAGKGAAFLSTPNPVVQTLLGNWNVASIVTLTSGTPFNALAGGDIANVGGGVQRAQRIGNPTTGFQRSRLKWFNTAAYASPAQYTFGNERRNDLIGPTYKDVDFNAFKNFPITERFNLQFRGEFFNIFNHTNYGIPANNVQATSFGQITSANTAREIQFALKAIF